MQGQDPGDPAEGPRPVLPHHRDPLTPGVEVALTRGQEGQLLGPGEGLDHGAEVAAAEHVGRVLDQPGDELGLPGAPSGRTRRLGVSLGKGGEQLQAPAWTPPATG